MAKPDGLIIRLLNTPGLPHIVPRLEPEILQRVIQACGLEDCAELVALATPKQLARVLDADVWRARRPGVDEAFDPDRFGVWLTVLLESGAAVAAEKLAGLDIDFVIAGLAHHIRAFDCAATTPYTTLDGEHVPGRTADGRLASEVGGYLIEAARSSAWDAILELLAFLDAERPEYFHRLMRGCVRVSSGPREQDGFHDLLNEDEQHMFDLTSGRELRREQRGFVAPAHARAFLQTARTLRVDADRPPPSAIARAYFRAMQSTGDTEAPAEPALNQTREDPHGSVAERGSVAVLELLEQAGLLTTTSPRALLGAAGQHGPSLSFLRSHAALHAAGEEELAYLANTIAAGCSIQGRPFTIPEASDCAAAVCNLGLESWPVQWPDSDLITAFQIGWTILHRDVCMYAAERLIRVLGDIDCSDRDIQLRLDGLRRGLIRHAANREPWHAGDALDVILMLDAPCWAALRALIDECPVVHAALRASKKPCRTIDPHDFDFISESGQIVAVREFLTALPSLLTA